MIRRFDQSNPKSKNLIKIVSLNDDVPRSVEYSYRVNLKNFNWKYIVKTKVRYYWDDLIFMVFDSGYISIFFNRFTHYSNVVFVSISNMKVKPYDAVLFFCPLDVTYFLVQFRYNKLSIRQPHCNCWDWYFTKFCWIELGFFLKYLLKISPYKKKR